MFIEETLKERVLQHWQGIFLQWCGRAAPKTLELQTPWTVRTLQSAETRCLVREVHNLVHNHHLEMRNWFYTRVLFPVWRVSKRTALYCTIFCPDSTMCRDYPRSRYNGTYYTYVIYCIMHLSHLVGFRAWAKPWSTSRPLRAREKHRRARTWRKRRRDRRQRSQRRAKVPKPERSQILEPRGRGWRVAWHISYMYGRIYDYNMYVLYIHNIIIYIYIYLWLYIGVIMLTSVWNHILFTDPGIRRAVSHGSGSFWDSCRGRVASRCHGAPKTREKWGVGPQVMAVEIHEIQGAFTWYIVNQGFGAARPFSDKQLSSAFGSFLWIPTFPTRATRWFKTCFRSSSAFC